MILRIFRIALVLANLVQMHLSLDLKSIMTDEEILQTFWTTRDLVPEHEVLRLRDRTVERSAGLNRRRLLSLSAFGEKYHLNLELRDDDVLIGRNTPIWHLHSNPLNSSDVQYTPITNILDGINGIYQDIDNMASLVTTSFDRDANVLYYDGVIGPGLAIRPLPRRVTTYMAQTNGNGNTSGNSINDTSSSSSSNTSGELEDHVVYRIHSQNLTQARSAESIIGEPVGNNRERSRRGARSGYKKSRALETLYLEVLVVVDSSLYKLIGKKPALALNYLIPFWNGVDLRYKSLRSPEVKVNIAGVVLTKDDKALKYLYDNFDEEGRIDAKEALLDAANYFNNKTDTAFIKHKDVIVTMTRRDLCSFKKNVFCKSSTLGKAFFSQACSRIKNTAILKDNGGYSGIITATHEIGHLLGLPHDGEFAAKNCSMKDGYIMASAKYRGVNSVKWSPCSRKILGRFAGNPSLSSCLGNKPANLGDSVLQNLPGKVLSLEEQCWARGGFPCAFNATVCWKLHCTKTFTNMKCIGKAPAAEGTACGSGLYCRNGECVPDESDIIQNKLRRDIGIDFASRTVETVL